MVGNFQVGQKLYFARNLQNKDGGQWVEITKFGKSWLTVKFCDSPSRLLRIRIESLVSENREGICFLSKQDYDSLFELKQVWSQLWSAVYAHPHVPDHLSVDDIREVFVKIFPVRG